MRATTSDRWSAKAAPISTKILWKSKSIPAAHLRQQTQDLQVQPHQRDHDSESAVPLHILGSAGRDAPLDEVEVQHQVQRRNRHHDQAESNPDHAAAVNAGELEAEEAQHQLQQVEDRHAARGRSLGRVCKIEKIER